MRPDSATPSLSSLSASAALHAGARLSEKQAGRIARRLSELTGLPLALVEERNLRIADATFFVELLRDRGLLVGRLDALSLIHI